MECVTYLLGAGASVKSLPVIKDFPNRLRSVINQLKNEYQFEGKFEDVPNSKEVSYYKQKLIQDFNWLLETLVRQRIESVDSFAKELYFQNPSDYYRLKALISCFFTLIQTQKYLPDPRYRAFFSEIVKDGYEKQDYIHNQINILSWNYDIQMEIGFSNFSQSKSLFDIQKKLRLVPTTYRDSTDNSIPWIVKLNGTATNAINTSLLDYGQISNNILKQSDENSVRDTLNAYALYLSDDPDINFKPALTYSWEKNDFAEKIRRRALALCARTTVLVCIGYSFNHVNNDTDRQLLASMTQLRRIYIQDPEFDMIKLRIPTSIRDNRIIKIDHNNPFHIPKEIR